MDQPVTAARYIPPTPDEVRAILSALGLTGGKAAALMGLADSRATRRYTGGAAPREMSFALLYTLVHRGCGVAVTPEGWRKEFGDALATPVAARCGHDA